EVEHLLRTQRVGRAAAAEASSTARVLRQREVLCARRHAYDARPAGQSANLPVQGARERELALWHSERLYLPFMLSLSLGQRATVPAFSPWHCVTGGWHSCCRYLRCCSRPATARSISRRLAWRLPRARPWRGTGFVLRCR